MIYTLDEIRARVQPVAERYNLKAVYIFGSYARGEARADSDVDLLVDCEGSGLQGFAYGGLYGDLEEALEKHISMVTVAALEQPAVYASEIHFRENVLQERKVIYGET